MVPDIPLMAGAIGGDGAAPGGAAYGSGESERSQRGLQRQYDIAYAQCMAAKGNDAPPPYGYRHRERYDDRDRYNCDRRAYDGPPRRE